MSDDRPIRELQEKALKDAASLTLSELKTLNEWKRLADGENSVDLGVAAELLGCSERNVKELVQDGKIIKGGRGRYTVRSICAHLREYRDKRYKGVDDATELGRQTVRFRKLKSDLAQYELDVKTGRLVYRDAVERDVRSIAQILGNLIDEWAVRLPESLAGMDVREIGAALEKEAREFRLEACRQLAKFDESENTRA